MPDPGDLKRAYETLKAKSLLHGIFWRYYDGEAPIRYVSERLREVFKDLDARFTLNWAAVVIDAEHERVQLKQVNIADNETAQKRANELLRLTQLDLDADDAHKNALVTGEAYLFIWKDEDGETEAYFNDSRLCHIFYDEENPRKKSFAAKWWVASSGKLHMNLYYSDTILYFVSDTEAGEVTDAAALKPAPVPEAPNPFGEIPLFHLRPERRATISRLKNVVEPQDAINKLFSDLMVSAEFGAAKQRWFVTNADMAAILSAPNQHIVIPAGDGVGEGTQVGEFDPTDLMNYLNAMDKLAGYIAIITRTPKHYLMQQGGDPSGEALSAMEAPLNKKATKGISRFKPTWTEAVAFMLKLDGMDVPTSSIEPLFERPETVQPRTLAEIREINTRAGMPLRTTLRREGWTDAEIEAMYAEPPDRATVVDLAIKIAAYIDRKTFVEVIAPAFGWDEKRVDGIYAAKQLEAEQQGRAEARGAVEAALNAAINTGGGNGVDNGTL